VYRAQRSTYRAGEQHTTFIASSMLEGVPTNCYLVFLASKEFKSSRIALLIFLLQADHSA
jgi:hypothetical protein